MMILKLDQTIAMSLREADVPRVQTSSDWQPTIPSLDVRVTF